MFRLDVSGRSLTIVAIASLTLLLLSSSAWAQHVGYPNPRGSGWPDDLELRDDQAIQPGHEFSFRARALADGGDPAGTQYDLQLRRRETSHITGDAETWSAWVIQQVEPGIYLYTKSTDDEEVFTWDSDLADLTAIDPEIPLGLQIDEVYQWRITDAGPIWTFHVPMSQPADGASEVGVYPKYIWDANPNQDLYGTPAAEVLHIWDLDAPGDGWVTVDGLGTITMNMANTYKEYVPARNEWHTSRREFWIHDDGYPRLYPNGRRYAWRISYHPIDPGLNVIYSEWVWADGGGDFDDGWLFTTIDEIDYTSNVEVESAVVFWQSQYGTLERNTFMGDYNFLSTAERLQHIHTNQHWPSIGTIPIGTQQVAASYGGNRSPTDAQAPYVDDVDGREGWYTIARLTKEDPDGFSRENQDMYQEYVSKGLRTFLQDAANQTDFGGDDFANLPNLQYVTLLGDAKRAAPSFYLHYTDPNHHWVATDFYYSTQDNSATVSEVPHYQVGRIPLRQKGHRTTDFDGAIYNPEVPAIEKIGDYATLLNSDAKKDLAYQTWFGRAVMVSGLTSYDRWFQFYPAAVQNILNSRISIGGGLLRDVFSGMKVRAYNFWGNGEERLIRENVERHLTNFSDPDDVPGFVYLTGIGDEFWSSGGTNGQTVRVTDFYTIAPDDFTDDYNDVTDGRRPVLVSSASLLTTFDNSILSAEGTEGLQSIGERGCLAPGGAAAVVGFSNGIYSSQRARTETYPDEADYEVTFSGNAVDEDGGYIYPTITQGQMVLEQDGDVDLGMVGRVEFLRRFAAEYASTTQSGIGNVFNHTLADYIADHQADFDADEQTVLANVMGATLLGDPAIIMPQREPANDSTRPEVTDTNPRAGNAVVGYTATTERYNSKSMPIHVIPRSTPYDPAVSTPEISLSIQTDAPAVRVRILTPFVQSNIPGSWHDTTHGYWSATTPEICTTTNSLCTFSFQLTRPSIHILIVQAQNPAWVQGTDPNEWRWLKERWFWIQTVNQFTRDTDANILVIDDDQLDRFHLHGIYTTNREDYYVTPGVDELGYTGVQDPATFSPIPALPFLNKYVGDSFQYQLWSSNMYRLDHLYADELLAAQQFYGEITPAALKSFQDSRGCVLYFKGDANSLFAPGFMFITNDMSYSTNYFLRDYLENGARLFVTDQILHTEIVNYLSEFQSDYLGNITATSDTDYTNMDGLQDGTLSTFIQDLNAAGGDGANNATWTGELDTNGTESQSIFFWDTASGPGTISSSGSSSIQNRLLASGARTIHFPWPFEAIQSMGSLTPDGSGRANVMRQILGWLRNVPKPSPVYPADGANGISREVVLEWTSIPEGYYYRIYINTDPNDLTQPGTIVLRDFPSYDPAKPGSPLEPLLDPQTRYYWRVDVLNQDQQTVTTGDVWSFTTVGPPVKANNPTPAHLEEQVPLDQRFSWNNTGTVTYYDLYLWETGQAAPAPGTETNRLATGLTTMYYQPTTELDPITAYSWRVDTYNELSPAAAPGLNLGAAQGDVWQFTTITPPPKPTAPVPQDLAVSVPTSQILSWAATERTDTYDVYVWTGNPLSVPAAPTATGVTDTQYVPTANFNTSTQYYWQVRPVNAAGRQNTVDTWTFTTSSVRSPGRPTNMYPADGDTNIPVDVTFTWTGGADTATYRIFIGAGSVPATPTALGLTTTSYTPAAPLTAGVVYSWRVDGVAADGITITSGLVVRFVTVGGTVYVQAYDPIPADDAVDVDAAAITLGWSGGATATGSNVYINGILDTYVAAGATATTTTTFQAGTTYTWRVDIIYPDGVGGEFIIDGETWTFTTAGTPPDDDGTGTGGGASSCFIATSAYEAASRAAAGVVRTNFTGDYIIPADRVEKLDAIRAMRDSFLNKFQNGRRFTAWYYAVGPYAAQAIRHNEPAKAAVRYMLLEPLSNISRQCEERGD